MRGEEEAEGETEEGDGVELEQHEVIAESGEEARSGCHGGSGGGMSSAVMSGVVKQRCQV